MFAIGRWAEVRTEVGHLPFESALVFPEARARFRSGFGRSLCIVERGFELGGWDVAEVAVYAAGVVPVHPRVASSTSSMDFHRLPAGGSVDQLGVVVAVDGLGQRVFLTAIDAADRWSNDFSEPLP